MKDNADIFLKKTLGDDFLEALSKTELWKPHAKVTIDTSDLNLGLKLVPRTIMSFLIHNLQGMQNGESKELKIPVKEDATLFVTKMDRDVYLGKITADNKMLTEFKYRSLPGLGLVLMSSFELYDLDQLGEHKPESNDLESKVQSLIDERVRLHDMVAQVVDKKLVQRDAVDRLIFAKLNDMLEGKKKIEAAPAAITVEKQEDMPKGPTKLKSFLSKVQNKKKEFSIQMVKGENLSCPDCRQQIFDGSNMSACICYGENWNSKIYIKKSEDGVKVRFGKGWTEDNLNLFLDLLRKKNA